MIRRFLAPIVFALASFGSSAAESQPRTQPPRIVAVGDLHGDFHAWRDIALAARIIDRRDRWAGGSTVLVQTGDIVDRGPDSLKIIRHLMKLQAEAPRSGGKVIVLVGNHEAMNMTGDLRYVHPGEFAAFATRNSDRLRKRVFENNKAAIAAAFRARSPDMTNQAVEAAWLAQNPLGKLEHQAAWSPRGQVGRWMISNPAIIKIADTLFVHGGLSVRYAGMSLDEINRRTAAALASGTIAADSIIHDPFGPLWYRGLITRAGEAENGGVSPAQTLAGAATYPTIAQELAAVLRPYGARRIVVGHTPNLSGIEISHGGRLVRIDTGISRHYGGKLSYLEIIGPRAIPHGVQRSPAPAPRR